MTEYRILTLLIGISLLYSLGGMGFRKLPRRLGIPLLLLGVSLWRGISSWNVWLACGLVGRFLCLGYGINQPLWKKGLYALGLSLPSLLINYNAFWFWAVPCVWGLSYYFSNHPKMGKYFPWRICEGLTGFTMGCLWSQVLL